MTSKQALVVDDSRSARKVLERMLQKANVSVSTVEDAESALAYLKQEVPGIIFMDHMMPGMNGLEATSELRKLPELENVPTIMYTSKDDSDYLAQAKAHGANDVLSKPAKQDKLEALIDLYLSTQQPSPETAVEVESESAPLSSADLSQRTQDDITNRRESQSELDQKVILMMIQQELNKFTPDLQQQLQSELQQTSQKLAEHTGSIQEQLEQKLLEGLEQNKTNPSVLFKTLQPVLQKLSLQVATKVVNASLSKAMDPLEDKLTEAQATISDLQSRQTQQLRNTSHEIRQLKLLAYSALVLSVAGFAAGLAILI